VTDRSSVTGGEFLHRTCHGIWTSEHEVTGDAVIKGDVPAATDHRSCDESAYERTTHSEII
jgi:hypothetical protein